MTRPHAQNINSIFFELIQEIYLKNRGVTAVIE